MAKNDLHLTRNIGIMAHIDAERQQTWTYPVSTPDLTHKIGEANDGAATMDWWVHRERGITITSLRYYQFAGNMLVIL